MIAGRPSIDHARARGITHWTTFPDVRDTVESRTSEDRFRCGVRRASEITRQDPGMTPERCDRFILIAESARSAIRRLGTTRALGTTLPNPMDRWHIGSYLRGISHGLQIVRPLLGMPYELAVWADAVDDWAAGDCDFPEFPPTPAWQPADTEVSA